MKKIFLLSSLCFIISSFGFTSEDTANANFLADQKIVTKQTTATGYRLDDKILRQEVIGMALKVKGVTLPENYTCKKYFADATKNDWICRAVELAADNGIISKSNTYANPGKSITRAEALAMVLFSGGFKKEDISKVTEGVFFDGYSEWQTEILNIAYWGGVIDVSKMDYALDYTVGGLEPARRYKFYPNRSATRAEVFAFAKGLIMASNVSIGGDLVVDAGDLIKTQESEVTTWKYYKSVEFSNIYKCKLETNSNSAVQFLDNAKIQSTPIKIFKNFNMIGLGQVFEMVANGGNIAYFSNSSRTYTLAWAGDSNGGGIDYCMKAVSGLYTPPLTSIDIFRIYYHNLGISWDKQTAYSMRSPAGVSLETFTSWYKNVETVTFREDTLKDLGNNTYEFLVDMTENGKKSTFKVKSKVNLEKFTIDNISSVKQ